jgi:hypothetical protein
MFQIQAQICINVFFVLHKVVYAKEMSSVKTAIIYLPLYVKISLFFCTPFSLCVSVLTISLFKLKIISVSYIIISYINNNEVLWFYHCYSRGVHSFSVTCWGMLPILVQMGGCLSHVKAYGLSVSNKNNFNSFMTFRSKKKIWSLRSNVTLSMSIEGYILPTLSFPSCAL